MAHLWAIPLAVAAYAQARVKWTQTAQYEEGIRQQIPKDFTLRAPGPAENYMDTPPALDEWEQGDTIRPYQKFRGVPWGVRQQMLRAKFFEPKYFVNSHVRHTKRRPIGGSDGPDWKFSQLQ